jgi:phosphoglycerate dehydrogenase-like enzyme
MIGTRELHMMKSTAFLINPARAELIDERALYEALRDNVIAGAALDPWWHYPKDREKAAPSDYPFRDLPNVVMTPHVSGYTTGTVERRFRVVAANIDRFARGEPIVNVVRELSRV